MEMNVNDEVLERVTDFIVNPFDYKRENLSLSTSMYHDLGTIGEDTDYIMRDFSEEFNIPLEKIDLSNFNIGVENFDILGQVYSFIKSKKKTITLMDLVTAIKTGKLE